MLPRRALRAQGRAAAAGPQGQQAQRRAGKHMGSAVDGRGIEDDLLLFVPEVPCVHVALMSA
jgi:hypothetical protein